METSEGQIDIPEKLSRRDRMWLGGAIFFLSKYRDKYRRGGKMIDFMLWMLKHNTLGRVESDIRAMSEATGLSKKTVHETVASLRDGGFVRKIEDGLYKIEYEAGSNPPYGGKKKKEEKQ